MSKLSIKQTRGGGGGGRETEKERCSIRETAESGSCNQGIEAIVARFLRWGLQESQQTRFEAKGIIKSRKLSYRNLTSVT